MQGLGALLGPGVGAPVLPGAAVNLCSRLVSVLPWLWEPVSFVGVSVAAACVSGHHDTVCCCTGTVICVVYSDFLVTARWGVCTCVYV